MYIHIYTHTHIYIIISECLPVYLWLISKAQIKYPKSTHMSKNVQNKCSIIGQLITATEQQGLQSEGLAFPSYHVSGPWPLRASDPHLL